MATIAKQNGTEKKETNTIQKTNVVKKLAKEGLENSTDLSSINLDERMNKFEKLRGLANQREKLQSTLIELARFNYNQDGSSAFFIKDASGLEFKTTNSNLIGLVSNQLQQTLEKRKSEIEKEIIEFRL